LAVIGLRFYLLHLRVIVWAKHNLINLYINVCTPSLVAFETRPFGRISITIYLGVFYRCYFSISQTALTIDTEASSGLCAWHDLIKSSLPSHIPNSFLILTAQPKWHIIISSSDTFLKACFSWVVMVNKQIFTASSNVFG
jgi:hypothetical protein